jgi:hypothetical protein
MRIPIRSTLVGLLLASSFSGALMPSALSKDFYTRKRVNGRWVYGEFPKKGSQAEQDRAAQQTSQPGQPTPAAPAAPSYGLGLHFPQQVQTPATNQAQAEQASPSDNVAATGSLRHRRRQVARLGKAPAARTRPARERAQEGNAHPEVRKKPEQVAPQAASRAVASAAPADDKARSPSTPSAPAEQAGDVAFDQTKRLAQALVAKAAALASGTISSAAEPLPKPKAEPVSVNYDYKKGVKTVVYANGAREEEPFDPATMKGLAATTRTIAAAP